MRLTFFSTFRGLLGAACLTLLPVMAAAQACPDIDIGSPVMFDSDATSLATASTFEVQAGGGKLNLSDCTEVPGSGFITPGANIELTLNGNAVAQRDLQVAASADCDSTLLVNDASGAWHFSDDEDSSLNPRVVLPLAGDGVIDIWVGSYEPGVSCMVTLSVSTLPQGTFVPTAETGGAGLCPDPNLSSAALDYTADQLATAQTQQIYAGGDLDLSACANVPGSGFITQAPDFQLNLTGNVTAQDVTIGVTAACDAVLMVNDASGAWQFVDDTNGTDPVVVIPAAQDGAYDIWVGSLMPEGCESTLSITTGQGGMTQPVNNGTEVLPDPGSLTMYRDRVGQVFSFEVTGSTSGMIWGSDIYTDDSSLATAAVHAGVLAPGQTGVVTVEIFGPYKGYEASNRNGVQSSDYRKWEGSFTFVRG